MYDIGIKKLNECMKLVAPTLERKMKDNIFRKEAIVKLRAYIESLATLPLYPAWHEMMQQQQLAPVLRDALAIAVIRVSTEIPSLIQG